MHSFEKTSLWRNSLGLTSNDDEADARQMLREQLLRIRTLVEQLVTTVIRDLPGMTVHDISHLDALWETASLIAGDEYPLNPAEAFVFGAAVLLHDAGMSLAAYPEGLSALQRTPQWQDAISSLLQASTGKPATAEELSNPPDHIIRSAVPDVLRELHASAAEKLPFVEWSIGKEPAQHLIQDVNFRNAYGSIIGKIAASHWWHPNELSRLPPRVNAGPGVPAQWFVHPIKLACLLRVADAAHIDHRRAPHFLRAILQPKGIADNHWNFQSKLGKPSKDKHFIVYTGGPFRVEDVEAWWLCYDLLSGVDDELRAAQSVLDAGGLQPFALSAVKGAKSPQATAELVRSEGWRPVNTELHVSDVPALIALLGGERLYGSNVAVVVRELIQNAADAVRAKQVAQGPNARLGNIHVRIHLDQDKKWWLEVEDEGIGMSPTVLTGALLDFGKSFWRSPSVRREFPGLVAKGLQSTGRYGIGFFSVFMLGDRVTVTSRRYDAGASETHTLDFLNGLKVRPVLRDADSSETVVQSGTCVRVQLKTPPDEKDGLLYRAHNNSDPLIKRLKDLVARQCPGIDVTVEVEEDPEKRECAVAANDWINEAPATLFSRASNGYDTGSVLKQIAPVMRELWDPKSDTLYGRACVYPSKYFYAKAGAVTVGGFRASEITGIAGLLVGESLTVSRDSAIPKVPPEVLRDWATEQAKLIAELNLADAEKERAAILVLALGGDSTPLPIAVRNGEHLAAAELRTLLQTLDEVVIYDKDEISHEEDDDITRRRFDDGFEVSPTLFLVPNTEPALVSAGDLRWPSCVEGLFANNQPHTCLERFVQLLAETWQLTPEEDADTRTVGEVDGYDISRDVIIYRRPHTEEDDPS